MNVLVVIPARGGSKGIPDKNIKLLGGVPLIHYSIQLARELVHDDWICVTTDSPKIAAVVEQAGLTVPFMRPDELSTDTADANGYLRHAYEWYAGKGQHVDILLLLQPTSPFRSVQNLRDALALYHDGLDMVVGVCRHKYPPGYNTFQVNDMGYLEPVVKTTADRRQDAALNFRYNGAIYVINPESLKFKNLSDFDKVLGYEMEERNSLDIDEPLDWEFAEFLLDKG